MKNNQVFKFIITGVINTLFYFTLYSLFIFLDIEYKIAVFLATLIGIFFSFYMFGAFVFNNRNKRLIFKFILVYFFLYILNIEVIRIVNHVLHNYYYSGFFAMMIGAIVSFVLNKFFVFRGG